MHTPVSDLLGLNPDGPHSAELTTDVAQAFTETVRFLNHATLPATDCPGLDGPPYVYEVIGALTRGTHELTQLTTQLGEYLTAEMSAGRVAVTYRQREGNPLDAVSTTCAALSAAGAAAAQMHAALNHAWSATAAMVAATDPDQDDDQDHDRDDDQEGGRGSDVVPDDAGGL